MTDDPSLTPGGEKGLKWKQALKDAFDIEFDGKKRAGGGDQFFEVEHIYVWGNNPVRESGHPESAFRAATGNLEPLTTGPLRRSAGRPTWRA